MNLSVYGEVTEQEQKKLDEYLKKHPDLKKEYQDLKKFSAFVSEHTSEKTTDALLGDARTQLRSSLRKERQRRSWSEEVTVAITELLRPSVIIGGTGTLALGMLIGYCSFSPNSMDPGVVILPAGGTTEDAPKTNITNVRFIDTDASDGEIEFEFDAVAPMHIKGKIDDPEIQRLLTHSLLNEANAGVRLSSVNAIRNQTENATTVDPAIKAALITSLKSDANPGVRREALRVLQQYRFDDDIRDAMLFVIAKDNNSGVRVAAINALEFARMEGMKFDEKTLNALKDQISKEQNNYIRNRAVNLVKEMYQ